jgi:hypothetical protein
MSELMSETQPLLWTYPKIIRAAFVAQKSETPRFSDKYQGRVDSSPFLMYTILNRFLEISVVRSQRPLFTIISSI